MNKDFEKLNAASKRIAAFAFDDVVVKNILIRCNSLRC